MVCSSNPIYTNVTIYILQDDEDFCILLCLVSKFKAFRFEPANESLLPVFRFTDKLNIGCSIL